MEQFEKQWEKNHPVWDMGEDTIGHYNKAKKYWREALEWAIQNEFVTDEIYKKLKG